MRFSIAAEALCGAVAVSALSIPKRANPQLVDLAPFEAHSMQLLPFEQAKADAQKAGVADPTAPAPTDGPKNSSASSGKDGAKTEELAETDAGSTAAAGTCTDPAIRVEWRNLADADKTNFVNAVKCLFGKPSAGGFQGSQNRYEDLVSVHQQMTGSIHQVGQFLPWHRYYVHVYESLLRNECGYAGPMPWWDETKDAGNFGAAPMFTDAYFGPAPAKTADGQGTCITTGAFAGITLHLGPGTGYSDHCLSRAVDESLTASCSADFVNTCNSRDNYGDMESCQESGPHGYGHNGIGSVMADVSPSPSDPIFFMHHGFVDHNWRIWQNVDTANRLYQVGGYTTTTDPKQPLTLDYVLSSMNLLPDVTVNDVMDTQGGYLCYRYDY